MSTTTGAPPALGTTEFLIRRKILTIFGAKFHIYDGDGKLVLYIKQKAFKLREDIRGYADESMQEERLLIRARQIIDFGAAYDVVDSKRNEKIGTLRRKGFKSLVRDSWEFLDRTDRPIAQLTEDSMTLALVRRFLLALVPQRFRVLAGDRTLASFRQRFNPFVYKLEVHLEPAVVDTIDPRLVVAAGILIGAIEGRQHG